MKSKEFIIEDMSNEFRHFVKIVKQHCSAYLSEVNDGWMTSNALYRGIKDSNDTIIQKSVRLENRNPKDMPIEAHNELNKMFTKRFGVPFRNGLFATGEIASVGQYGTPYIIFPVGNFKYAWTEFIYDLSDYYGGGSWIPDEIESFSSQDERAKMFTSQLSKWDEYNNTNLVKGIHEGNEIMFWTKSYIGISNSISDQDKEMIEGMLK